MIAALQGHLAAPFVGARLFCRSAGRCWEENKKKMNILFYKVWAWIGQVSPGVGGWQGARHTRRNARQSTTCWTTRHQTPEPTIRMPGR